jgi:hypothetical protein
VLRLLLRPGRKQGVRPALCCLLLALLLSQQALCWGAMALACSGNDSTSSVPAAPG